MYNYYFQCCCVVFEERERRIMGLVAEKKKGEGLDNVRLWLSGSLSHHFIRD